MQSMTVAKYLLQRRIAHDALIPQLCMDLDNLVERAKAKDPQAFDTLYKMYFRKMMGVCLKIIKGDEETAKDLVHDAFVLAFISLGDLRNNRKFGEWLTTYRPERVLQKCGEEKWNPFGSAYVCVW